MPINSEVTITFLMDFYVSSKLQDVGISACHGTDKLSEQAKIAAGRLNLFPAGRLLEAQIGRCRSRVPGQEIQGDTRDAVSPCCDTGKQRINNLQCSVLQQLTYREQVGYPADQADDGQMVDADKNAGAPTECQFGAVR